MNLWESSSTTKTMRRNEKLLILVIVEFICIHKVCVIKWIRRRCVLWACVARLPSIKLNFNCFFPLFFPFYIFLKGFRDLSVISHPHEKQSFNFSRTWQSFSFFSQCRQTKIQKTLKWFKRSEKNSRKLSQEGKKHFLQIRVKKRSTFLYLMKFFFFTKLLKTLSSNFCEKFIIFFFLHKFEKLRFFFLCFPFWIFHSNFRVGEKKLINRVLCVWERAEKL